MYKCLLIGLVIIAALGLLIYGTLKEPVKNHISDSPVEVSTEPIQIEAKSTTIAPLQIGKTRYFFYPKASYKISGVLVSKRKYIRGADSRISPYDFALVWGSLPNILPLLKFEQTYRYCLYKYNESLPVDLAYLQTHMSNNHLIPSNNNIRRALSTFRKGDLVEIEGFLVNVSYNIARRGSSNWNTSLVRTDTGDGACEIIYIVRIKRNNVIYE